MLRFFLLLAGLAVAFPVLAQKKPVKKEKDLYDVDRIVEIRLYFKDPKWAVRLDSLRDTGEDERLVGSLVLDGTRYEQVGVRYKGNSSFNSVRKDGFKKLPLNIEVNYGKPTQMLSGGYQTLKLSNVFRDPSFLREVLAYEVARRYVPAPRANFAKVFINDEYMGFYNSSESVDEKFLRDNYGSEAGALFKCDPVWADRQLPNCPAGYRSNLAYLGEDTTCYTGLYEIKTPGAWPRLIDLTRKLQKGGNELETTLDIDQTLWMMAYNNVLVNLDSYNGMLCHNYYLYQDTSGLFHPILWDMNLCFGGFRYAGEPEGAALTNQQMQEFSPLTHLRNPKYPLVSKLLSNGLYRKIYVAHMRTIIQDYFTSGKLMERARALHKLIAPFVETDKSKLYSYEEFKRNIDSTSHIDDQDIIGLAELMDKRAAYLSSHPLLAAPAPQFAEVKHRRDGKSIWVDALVQGADKCWLYYRPSARAPFRRLEMTGVSVDGEQQAEEQRWTVAFVGGTGAQYYLVAETDRTASLSPERASREFHKVVEEKK